ncbi:MAG: hypothetical protein K8F91_07755 [Candidatus Obscuribacterales bacterium]|nr:hypothetical protein [Candidatus Obscuribacterales bacterium]
MSSDKKLVQTALEQLHKTSGHPQDQQWFTRRAIGQQMKAPSGGLSSRRQNALEQLAEAGVVERRHKADDGKQTYEYRLKQ